MEATLCAAEDSQIRKNTRICEHWLSSDEEEEEDGDGDDEVESVAEDEEEKQHRDLYPQTRPN